MNNIQESANGVHIVYKQLGETPLECLVRYQKGYPELADEKMTYAGRLDPMAEGLLVLLSGDAVHKKEEYLKMSKTYEVEVLWGIATDTGDVLGITMPVFVRTQTKTGIVMQRQALFSEYVTSLIGQKSFSQKYPAYSSKPIDGKPAFVWAREGKNVEQVVHDVSLYSAQYGGQKNISGANLLHTIQERVGKVTGDFRQDEILKKWQEVLEKEKETELVIDTITLSVSSGFYVRQFVEDFAQSIGVPALSFHIKRTKIGLFDNTDFHN